MERRGRGDGSKGVAGVNGEFQAATNFIWTIKSYKHINKTIKIDATLQGLGTKDRTMPKKKTFLTV